jgi:hypothetical protein
MGEGQGQAGRQACPPNHTAYHVFDCMSCTWRAASLAPGLAPFAQCPDPARLLFSLQKTEK